MQKKLLIQSLKGFRDFLPNEKRIRDYIENKFIEVFEDYGFMPFQNPTLEYADLLMNKYGEEADKLIYKFIDKGGREVAMRYDQTIPISRVLYQYRDKLPKYFRRYQIQNVFRADKPQKGRYREFTQCDIDVFGTKSEVADAEIVACTYSVFKNIGYKNIVLKINDRKILFDTLNKFSTKDLSILSIIQTIDKLDKLTEEEVVQELVKKGMEKVNALSALKLISKSSMTEYLKNVFKYSVNLGVPNDNLVFTPILARGLDYYTDMILEVVIPEYSIGSCAGGGRYNNLINKLSGFDVPAVGIAFGFDRIVESAQLLGLVPTSQMRNQILVTVLQDTLEDSLLISKNLRLSGLDTEVYVNPNDNLSKQLKYASENKFIFVVIIGSEEKDKGVASIKFMDTGKQKEVPLNQLAVYFKGFVK